MGSTNRGKNHSRPDRNESFICSGKQKGRQITLVHSHNDNNSDNNDSNNNNNNDLNNNNNSDNNDDNNNNNNFI